MAAGQSQDPGWRAALSWKLFLFAAAPALLTRGLAGDEPGSVLMRVRGLWLSQIVTVAYIVAVTTFVSGEQDVSETPAWWWAAQIGYGALNIGLVLWARKRPLDATDDESLRKSYLASFMLGYAFTMSPAIIGFVGVFVVGGMAPLLVGLILFAVALLLNAPTRAAIERRQSELQGQGSTRSLMDALSSPDSTSTVERHQGT